MPRRIAMGTLVTRCQQFADKGTGDDHIATAEWKSRISLKYAELYGVVCDVGSRYFETTSTITATGASSYTEPSDHRNTIGMDLVNSDGSRRAVFELMIPERNLYAGQTGEASYFQHIDDQIYLHPNPSSGTYRYLYIPQAPDLSSYADADLVDVCDGSGEAFLLWGVAAEAKLKSESDASNEMMLAAKAKEELREWAVRRMLTEPRRKVLDEWVEPGWDTWNWRYRG